MFTGIVRAVGEVVGIEEEEDGVRAFEIRAAADFLEGVKIGASIALDGACLTAVTLAGDEFRVQAVRPTLEKTIIGGYRVGSRVNLEKALSAGDPLDGHLVQGHIDGIGYIRAVRGEQGGHVLEVELPESVRRHTLPQGSITLNGVSLTISAVLPSERIEVTIIPHSWAETNLRYLSVGEPVNVEGDLIGKYVGRMLNPGGDRAL